MHHLISWAYFNGRLKRPFLQNPFAADSVVHAVAYLAPFIRSRLLVFSLLPPFSLLLPTLPTAWRSPSLCASVILPRPFYLSQSFFLPICFLFCAVSSNSLVMFFSLRSPFRTSEGDQEKIGLRNLQLKAPVQRLLSTSQCNIVKDSDLVPIRLRNKLLVVAHV